MSTHQALLDPAVLRALDPSFIDLPSEESVLEGVASRYAVLELGAEDPRRAAVLDVVDLAALPGEPDVVVVRRYSRGDYALPHRFGEEVAGAGWGVHVALQDSLVDGLTFWDGQEFTRVLDTAGTPVRPAMDAWCWTSPVRADVRYTVTIGGRA
ncbi:hypothetical protein [Thermoactinospora rubra]|uniref:hypothetical protein n=1 Tax=Thermoactinospora rubra TaxID=1088767 RepID=UPI0011815EDA|nr:hypothetical protein [Thermoactinospora rubra]